jgi:hypothetical protein
MHLCLIESSPFLWCVVVAQLAGRTVDTISAYWIGNKLGTGDYYPYNWIKHDLDLASLKPRLLSNWFIDIKWVDM